MNGDEIEKNITESQEEVTPREQALILWQREYTQLLNEEVDLSERRSQLERMREEQSFIFSSFEEIHSGIFDGFENPGDILSSVEIPDDVKKAILFMDIYDEVDSALSSIERKSKKNIVIERMQDLLLKIDSSKVYKHILNGGGWDRYIYILEDSLAYVENYRDRDVDEQTLTNGKQLYSDLMRAADSEGYLMDPSDSITQTEVSLADTIEITQNIRKTLDAIRDTIENGLNTLGEYRDINACASFSYRINNGSDTLKKTLNRRSEGKQKLLGAQQQAIEDWKQELMSKGYLSRDEKALQTLKENVENINIIREVMDVRIEGVSGELPEGGEYCVTEWDIMSIVTQNASPLVIQKMSNIRFVAKDSLGERTIGRVEDDTWADGELQEATISIAVEPWIIQEGDDPQHNKNKSAREREIRRILTHEIGHVFHMNLDIEDLQKIDRVFEDHPECVTPYVAECQAKEQYERRKREDFCESFELFLSSPYRLMKSSVDRFNLMVNLISKYYTEDQKRALKEYITGSIEIERELYTQMNLDPVIRYDPDEYKTKTP